MEKCQRCIIICAGDLEISQIPLKEDDLVVAVDGGYMYCRVLEITPDVIIGDFDSLEEPYASEVRELEAARVAEPGESDVSCTSENREAAEGECSRVIRLDREKDDTDTMAAIRYGLQAGCREFHLYAAMGGRLEHTIANLQTLLFLKKNGAKGYLWDAFSMTTVICNESISFRESMEGILSVFAMGGDAKGVTETGLKYQLQDALLENSFPKGISNEFIGEEATVSVKDGSLLILARWE